MKLIALAVRKHLVVWLVAVFAAGLLTGCGGGSDDPTTPVTPQLHLDFVRDAALADGSFNAVAWLSDAGGANVAFTSPPTLISTRGTVSAFTPRGDGKLEATVTPDTAKTGEYTLTLSASVSGNSLSVSHTAIVMEQVADGWGQPVSIDGLVNTNATQDSLAVSPDGQYLVLQYYPVSLNCILSGDPNSAFCQTPVGPVTAPQRPNMPGADRVGANSVHHGCPSVNFDPSPVPVPPIALYGFHRQADGSYAEPFVFRFNGGDGCFAPWGPSFRSNGGGSYHMFVAFNDPRNSGTPSDFAHLYDFDFTPGTTQALGDVSIAGAALQINNFVLNQATIAGTDAHRGNPHVFYNGNTPAMLFYDDETQPAANQYIHAASWNGSSWNAAVALNFAPFNTTHYGDTQPYFDGTQLVLRNGLQLLSYAYDGGGVANASSWSAPVVLLSPTVLPQTGNLMVVGEPTIAIIDGVQTLFFIYGILQADGSVNLRAGSVSKR